MDIEIVEKFSSKRNHVYKVKIHTSSSAVLAVMKKYEKENTRLLAVEYNNLNMLRRSGLSVPEVIYKDEGSLFLQHIEGILVNDLAESLDMGDWIDDLALWMSKLHQISAGAFSMLKGDANLKNFIYGSNKIYGLDFEEMKRGDGRMDLADLCFFMLTNAPSFTKEKHLMMRKLLKSYEKYSGSQLKDMAGYLLLSKAEAKIRRSGNIQNKLNSEEPI